MFFTEYCVHYTSTILYPVKKKLIGKISKYTVNNKYVVSSEGREGGRKEEELSINKIFKFWCNNYTCIVIYSILVYIYVNNIRIDGLSYFVHYVLSYYYGDTITSCWCCSKCCLFFNFIIVLIIPVVVIFYTTVYI